MKKEGRVIIVLRIISESVGYKKTKKKKKREREEEEEKDCIV